MRKDLEGEYIPRLKSHGLDSRSTPKPACSSSSSCTDGGNYARILNRPVASAGSAPTLTPWPTPSKPGEWYAVGQRYVIALPDDQEPRHEGHHPGARRPGGDNSKDGEDKAKEEKKIKHARTDGSGVLRIYMSDGPTPPPIPKWEASGRPTEPTRNRTTGTTRRTAAAVAVAVAGVTPARSVR